MLDNAMATINTNINKYNQYNIHSKTDDNERLNQNFVNLLNNRQSNVSDNVSDK